MAVNGSVNRSLREGESITYMTANRSSPPDLRFIHYNDVYHVEPGSREPVGGIARFRSLCQYYQTDDSFQNAPKVLTFFSGDAFNPSLESSVTKGKHMLGALNAIRTDVACLGNHDLDFGVEQFRYLAAQCNFPWLCANVLDPALGEQVPLGNCKRTVMLESSNGIKVGVIGVVEREWLDTINTLPPNLLYHSASATVSELAPKLRTEGAEMVVVVSHQREPNDNKLASKLMPGTVDIILGGHDHYYLHSIVNGTHILRSGTDFKQLSYLECRRKTDGSGSWEFEIMRRDVVSSIPEDPEAVAVVEKITASLRPRLEKPIGYTAAPLDARFTTVRLRESNLGNFIADLMRFHYGADCCIMAAGTIRGDQVYPPGILRVKDMMNCFPFEDPCVVIALKGKEILMALENGVGKYPALEGRFPQVSNISFSFDPAKEPGQRCFEVQVKGEPIDLEREYTMVARDYMVRGKDGFTSLMLDSHGGPARSIVSDENGVLISTILRQYFMSLKVLGKWKTWGDHMGRHWDKVHGGLHGVHPVQPTTPMKKATSLATSSHGTGNVDLEKVHHNGERRRSLVGTAQVVDIPDRPAKSRKLQHDQHQDRQQHRHEHQRPEGEVESEDSEDDEEHGVQPSHPSSEREDLMKRKVTRKWMRLAGVTKNPETISAFHGEEFGVHWTRGICPRVEGRIRIVGGGVAE